MRVLNNAFNDPHSDEEVAATYLAGGLVQRGYQCGMIWGASLAAGAKAFKEHGAGIEAESKTIQTSKQLVEDFRRTTKHINCCDISKTDYKTSSFKLFIRFFLFAGAIKCILIAFRYARKALKTILGHIPGASSEDLSAPICCTSLLAEKMKESDLHKTMVSGLAGGIGLCGGGCGALGVAIWFNELKNLKNDQSTMDFKDPVKLKIIEDFKLVTSGEFECSKIVGRKFKDIKDHAKFIQQGGCKDILEILSGS